MSEKIVVGPFNRGLRNDVTPFNIDNDSFPVLINAYQWRGRVKRKRGTAPLGRLQRYIGTTDGAGGLVVTILPIPIEAGIVSFIIDTDIFVDGGGASPVALTTNSSGTGTLDRATGVLTIVGSLANTDVIYFPRLPVMGLEDLSLESSQYPGTLAFDTHYAYNISTQAPYDITDVSFYKNPSSSSLLSLYVPKTDWTLLWWNGQDYQQFWSTNYEGALWVTNGINVPFTGATIGMQFAPAADITFSSTTATTLTVTIANCPLVIGDFVFVNEWTAGLPEDAATLNFQSGYVTAAAPGTPALALKTITITLPNANITNVAYVPGIIQYLTNRSNTSVDCIRWYDGDPTDGNVPPTFITGKGWVNFMPPLSQAAFSIADLPAAVYYLVGARMLLPFKDRLLAIGPVVQTSLGAPIYLQDTVIYCENGTPYYTASFQGDPRFPTTPPGILSILVPENQTAFPAAWFEDTTGFGGYISAGIQQPAITASTNEDVLIIGFNTLQTKLV